MVAHVICPEVTFSVLQLHSYLDCVQQLVFVQFHPSLENHPIPYLLIVGLNTIDFLSFLIFYNFCRTPEGKTFVFQEQYFCPLGIVMKYFA